MFQTTTRSNCYLLRYLKASKTSNLSMPSKRKDAISELAEFNADTLQTTGYFSSSVHLRYYEWLIVWFWLVCATIHRSYITSWLDPPGQFVSAPGRNVSPLSVRNSVVDQTSFSAPPGDVVPDAVFYFTVQETEEQRNPETLHRK